MTSRDSPPARPALPRESWLVTALVAALLLQLLYGLTSDGITDDEPIYVASGYRHLLGDFRTTREQPPFAKVLAALPLLILHPRVPELGRNENPEAWSFGVVHAQNDDKPLVPRARLPAVVGTALLCLVAWSWARAAAGPGVALLTLAFLTFQPALLAHGHLATTDLFAALWMLVASAAFWLFIGQASLGRAVLTAMALGLGVSTRLTAWLLAPLFLVLALVARSGKGGWRRRARAVSLLAGATVVVVPLVIWASYGFRFEPWPGAPASFASHPAGHVGELLRWTAHHRLLPEAYLEGARFQLSHAVSGHHAYLLGQRSDKGFPHYYLVALLVKNTPGFLLLAGVAAWLAATRKPPPGNARLHWLTTAAAIVAGASAGRVNIGERYILAAYPYLILWIASTIGAAWGSPRVRRAVGMALAAHVAPILLAAPSGYLSYFNLIAGGAQGGHRWLADSNLDWGQDLPRLAGWIRASGEPCVRLAYFGSDEPDHYGIRYDHLYSGPGDHPGHPVQCSPTAPVVLSPNVMLGFLDPSGADPYAGLRARAPDERAGIFFVYRPARGDDSSPPS